MNHKKFYTLGILLSLLSIQLLGMSNLSTAAVDFENTTGVILFIGDGMGPNHVELGRLVEYGADGESAILEFPYRTTINTNSIDKITTDSAASGTAIATGVSTRNGRIATNYNAEMDLTTILEIAQENDYATGIVATCHLTHATPASFMAHDESRNNYVSIAGDISNADVDVLLGGGSGDSYLGTYISAMEGYGYSYISNKTAMASASTTPLLGLFSSESLVPYYEKTDVSTEPTILEMTMKAISMLNSTGKPFFLMVEGSQIDWGAHDNDPTYAGLETIEFEKAVSYAKQLGESDPNLQILVTADHETGGLSIEDCNFITPLPSSFGSETEKRQARINRSTEVSVKWSTGGHTSTEVYLTGMGPNSDKISTAEHHTDTFSIMREVVDGETEPDGSGWYQGHVSMIVWYSLGGVGIIGVISTLVVVLVKRKKKKKAK